MLLTTNTKQDRVTWDVESKFERMLVLGLYKARLSGTVIKRIKYGAQRISGRISAVMSVNIKYCILREREPGSNCAASIAPLIFVMHRVKRQMKILQCSVFVVVSDSALCPPGN